MIFLIGTGILIKITAIILGAGGVALGGSYIRSWGKKEQRRAKKESKK